jgi:hypothetical protein
MGMVRLEILRRKIFRILLKDWKIKSDLYTLLCYIIYILFIYYNQNLLDSLLLLYNYKQKINKNKNIIISYG